MRDHTQDAKFDSLFDEASTRSKQDESVTLPSGNTFSTCSNKELDRRIAQAMLVRDFNNWTAAPVQPDKNGKMRGMRGRGGADNQNILKYWKEHDPQPEGEFSQSRLDAKRRLQGIDPPASGVSTSPALTEASASTPKLEVVKPQRPLGRSTDTSGTPTSQPSQTDSSPSPASENDFKIVQGLFDLSYKQYADGTTEMIRDEGFKRAEIHINYIDGLTEARPDVGNDDDSDSGVDMSYDAGQSWSRRPHGSRRYPRTVSRSQPRQAPLARLERSDRSRQLWGSDDEETDRARQLQRLRNDGSGTGGYHGVDSDYAAPRGTQASRNGTAFDEMPSRMNQFARSRAIPADYDDPTQRTHQLTRTQGDPSDDARLRQAQFSRRRPGMADDDSETGRRQQFSRHRPSRSLGTTGVDSEADRRHQFSRHRPHRATDDRDDADIQDEDSEYKQRRSQFARSRRGLADKFTDVDEADARSRQFRSQKLADTYGTGDGSMRGSFDDTEDIAARKEQMTRRRRQDDNGSDIGAGLFASSADDDEAEARIRQMSRRRREPGYDSEDDEEARARQFHRHRPENSTNLDYEDSEDDRRQQMTRQRSPGSAYPLADSEEDRTSQMTRNRRNVFSPIDTAPDTGNDTFFSVAPEPMMHGANGPRSGMPYSTQNSSAPSTADAPLERSPPSSTQLREPSFNPSLYSHPHTRIPGEAAREKPRNILFADQPHGEERTAPTAYTQPGSQNSAWPTRGPLSSIPPPQQTLRFQSPRNVADSTPPTEHFSSDERTRGDGLPPGATSEGTNMTFDSRDSQHAREDFARQKRWSTGAKVAAGLGSAAGVAGGAYYLYNHPETISDMSTHASHAWEGAKSAASSAYNDPSAAWEATKSGVGSMASSMKDTGATLYTTASDYVPSAESVITTARGVTSSVAGAMDTAASYLPGPVRRFGAGALGHLAQGRVASAIQSAAGL